MYCGLCTAVSSSSLINAPSSSTTPRMINTYHKNEKTKTHLVPFPPTGGRRVTPKLVLGSRAKGQVEDPPGAATTSQKFDIRIWNLKISNLKNALTKNNVDISTTKIILDWDVFYPTRVVGRSVKKLPAFWSSRWRKRWQTPDEFSKVGSANFEESWSRWSIIKMNAENKFKINVFVCAERYAYLLLMAFVLAEADGRICSGAWRTIFTSFKTKLVSMMNFMKLVRWKIELRRS